MDNPSGVKIRYKLVQGRLAKNATLLPEITQVLGAVQGNVLHWLDLDTGRQMPLSFPDDEAAKLALFRTNGLDVMGIVTKEEIGLACREMVVRQVEGSRWDRATAEEIVSETTTAPVGSEANAVLVITTSPRRTVTRFFRTREGGHGILQIIGQSENPLGVKIRYKLVQTASGPNAGPLPDAPESRSPPGSVAAGYATAAVNIDKVTVEAGRVTIQGNTEESHEVVVRIDRHEKPMEWRSWGRGSVFEVVVEASNKISLGGGKTSHGFVVTTKHGASKTGGNTFYVALTEGNPVVGTFAIRRKADLVTKDGVLTFADVTLKDGKKLPVSVRLEPKQTARANEELIGEEIQRIARNIKVIADGENAPKPLPLLKGPLLRHRSLGNYVCGTVWGWGEPGRPEALLSLSLTGPPAAPSWCHEMVSLSTRPIRATTRTQTWWATEAGAWSPQAIPNAAPPAENADQRFGEMKALAKRFAALRVAWQGDELSELVLLPEPILRYGNPSSPSIDGGLFVFVEGINNPEVLLVIEAEKQGGGVPSWKYHLARLSANGLVVKLQGKEVWKQPEIEADSTQVSDLYRIFFVTAKEETEASERETEQAAEKGR